MSTIVIVFVGVLCMSLGVRTMNAEERNKIFNKRPIQVEDVRKYNRFCGWLIIGYGIVAEITLCFMVSIPGIVSALMTVLMIVEAVLVMVIYNKAESKMLKKRY